MNLRGVVATTIFITRCAPTLTRAHGFDFSDRLLRLRDAHGETRRPRGERTRRLLAHQEENPDCDLFHDWEPHEHPELGEVEIGGLDRATHGNPPAEEMPDVAADVTEFVLRVAAYRPDVEISALDADHLGSDLYRVSATVVNRGRLSTSLTERGAATDTHVPDRPRVELRSDAALSVVSGTPRLKLDHLDANGGRATTEWVVRAPDGATAELSVTSVRGVSASEEVALE